MSASAVVLAALHNDSEMTVITRNTLRSLYEVFLYYAVKSVKRETYFYHQHRTLCGHHAELYTTPVPHIIIIIISNLSNDRSKASS